MQLNELLLLFFLIFSWVGVEEKEDRPRLACSWQCLCSGNSASSVINELHDELNQLEEAKSRDKRDRAREKDTKSYESLMRIIQVLCGIVSHNYRVFTLTLTKLKLQGICASTHVTESSHNNLSCIIRFSYFISPSFSPKFSLSVSEYKFNKYLRLICSCCAY